jgi:anti-sigma factor RsiW
MSEQEQSPKHDDENQICIQVMDQLGEFVDGELDPANHRRFEMHINECAECAAFVAGYKDVISLAAELKEPERPLQVDVQNRLRQALNQRLGLDLAYIA